MASAVHGLCVCGGVRPPIVLRTSPIAKGVQGGVKNRISEVRDEWPRRNRVSAGGGAEPGRRISVRAASSGRAVRSEAVVEEKKKEKKKRMANLRVEKRQSVALPIYEDAAGSPLHLSAFLREPAGMECMLNSRALRRYESNGDGVFKCYLPAVDFLSFEVAPVLDLAVDPAEDGCRVELLACKFEGSDIIRRQNERFAASMKNRLSWDQRDELRVRLELDVSLEVYTLPFALLPISAVEVPGNLILGALVDRLIPLFVQQLLTDFRAWAEARLAGDGADGSVAAVAEGDREKVNVGSIRD